MATRSTISIKNTDGTFKQVYCHWDGYPSNNGFLLLLNYQDEDKINKLFQHGDISSLRENVDIPKGKSHTFDKALDDVTVFYSRDRGDQMDPPLEFKNLKAFAKNGNFQEYDYVYDMEKKEWFLFKPDLVNSPDAFAPLVDVVKQAYDELHDEYKKQFDVFLTKPYRKAYEELSAKLKADSNVGVPKHPKKPLPSDHPQIPLEGLSEEVDSGNKKKPKI